MNETTRHELQQYRSQVRADTAPLITSFSTVFVYGPTNTFPNMIEMRVVRDDGKEVSAYLSKAQANMLATLLKVAASSIELE